VLKLKPLSRDAIAGALEKAHRYRLLNEPAEAESICLDVLDIEPDNQQALVNLLLAMTDQFVDGGSEAVERARVLLPRLKEPYERAYYAGIVCERRAKALLKRRSPGSLTGASRALHDAMRHFEEAEALRPHGNDDALLRWNTCMRFLMSHPQLESVEEEQFESYLE
jgi:hypothetical protein